ncbi:hypothetical protein HJFPF1_05214 [Paramyrothecium foliicola]|nr:hypothetical protein HJFPF1_05214 [Paramyrothecium foliicola]
MRGITSIITLALAAIPAVVAQAPISGNGICTKNRNRPNDDRLVCVFGQGAAILDCYKGECSEDGSACYFDQSCEGCAWYIQCT